MSQKRFDLITKIEIILNLINLLLAKARSFSDKDIFLKLVKIKNKIYYDYNFFDYDNILENLLLIENKLQKYEK